MLLNGDDQEVIYKVLHIDEEMFEAGIISLFNNSLNYKTVLEQAKIRNEKEKLKNKVTKTLKSDLEKFEKIENRCIKIMDNFIESQKAKASVIKYINLCREKYKEDLSQMSDKTIDTLHNALEFIDYDTVDYRNCTFFTKACIANMQYKRANSFITFSMQNDLITTQDKKKLHMLRKSVDIAQKKSQEIDKNVGRKNERVIA